MNEETSSHLKDVGVFEIQANNSSLISNLDSKMSFTRFASGCFIPMVCSEPAASALLPELLVISQKLKGGNNFY